MIDFLVHHRSLQLLVTSVQRRRRSKCVAGRALVRLGYGGSGSEVGDSCYASRNISAVGFGSRLLFFASTTRNSISLRSRLANDSAISLATSWWWRPVVDTSDQVLNFIRLDRRSLIQGNYLPLCVHRLLRSVDRPRGHRPRKLPHYPVNTSID